MNWAFTVTICIAKREWKLILEVIDLSKSLGKVKAVDSMGLKVFEGEIFASTRYGEETGLMV
jgi:hypothetical protein